MTKEDAIKANHGDHFHHVTEVNSDGTPVRVRVGGKCKTWVTREADFRLPVKYGLYSSFYLTQENMHEWKKGYGS